MNSLVLQVWISGTENWGRERALGMGWTRLLARSHIGRYEGGERSGGYREIIPTYLLDLRNKSRFSLQSIRLLLSLHDNHIKCRASKQASRYVHYQCSSFSPSNTYQFMHPLSINQFKQQPTRSLGDVIEYLRYQILKNNTRSKVALHPDRSNRVGRLFGYLKRQMSFQRQPCMFMLCL